MHVTVSSKGQVVIPAELRRKYGLETGARISLVDMGGVIYIVPSSSDSLAELRGMFADTAGLSSAGVDDARRNDHEQENKRWSLE